MRQTLYPLDTRYSPEFWMQRTDMHCGASYRRSEHGELLAEQSREVHRYRAQNVPPRLASAEARPCDQQVRNREPWSHFTRRFPRAHQQR